MMVGVPKEVKPQEHRVALLPSAAYQLQRQGHRVLVERQAGVGSGYSDEEYAQAGATLVDEHAQIFAEAELVVKVKEPLLLIVTLPPALVAKVPVARTRLASGVTLSMSCTPLSKPGAATDNWVLPAAR